jgi:hypothetical protein
MQNQDKKLVEILVRRCQLKRNFRRPENGRDDNIKENFREEYGRL